MPVSALVLGMVASLSQLHAQLVDITQPDDPIVATSNRSPLGEDVAKAIDNQPTKYLNFDRDFAGFTVTPRIGQTRLEAITLTSANDSPERDPATFELRGSVDGESFELIASGPVPSFTSRFQKVTIPFENALVYTSYRLIFPTVAGPGGNSMQISEVELLGEVPPPDITSPGDPIVATSNNSPVVESVINAIDDQPTKYLNFDRLLAGFTVTPRVGATVVTGISIQSANDFAERDPASFDLLGSLDGERFTRIATGSIPPFTRRFQKRALTFPNNSAYTSYRLIFPTVRGPGGNSMQVAEVELLGSRSVLSQGFLKFEAFATGEGNDVAKLTSHPSFPNSPTETRYLSAFDSRQVYPDDSHEGYGARISGAFIPETSGNWIFYIRSDDNSVLFLNPNGPDPAGKVELTAEPDWGRPFSAHASAPVALVAGRAYYIEALYKEGIGGDYCQVAAKLESDPTPPDSLQPLGGTRLATFAPPTDSDFGWSKEPVSQWINQSPIAYAVDFSTSDGGFTVTTPIAYEGPWVYVASSGSWQQNGQQAENRHPNTSLLTSPAIPILAGGSLFLSFTHRFSFEPEWDGGLIRVSRNGGPFTALPGSVFRQNGYANQRIAPNSLAEIAGQEAFVSASPGYASGFITSVADLGDVGAGDTIQIQFVASGDTNTGGSIPNWQIDSMSLLRHTSFATDFNGTDAGFTVTTPQAYQGPWAYDPATGSWRQDGQQAEIGHATTSFLTSPAISVLSSGPLRIQFTHRFSFEFDGTAWDGGQLLISRNGGAFVTVPAAAFTQNGYGPRLIAGSSLSVLKGQAGFTGDSEGYATNFLTSVADLGTFETGDTIRIQFVAAGDSNTGGKLPNWQIDSLRIDWNGQSVARFFGEARLTGPGTAGLPVSYQWQQDCGLGFETIPGATTPVFQLPVSLSDNGCQFRLTARAPGSTLTSAPVVVAVVSPNFGPTILTQAVPASTTSISLRGRGTPGQILGVLTSVDLVDWRPLGDVLVRSDGTIRTSTQVLDPDQQFFWLDWTATQPFPTGLQNWWDAEDAFGDSFGPLNGTTPGQPPGFEPGPRGLAFRFNGVDQYIATQGGPFPIPWTAGFWIKREDALDPSAALVSDQFTALKLEQFGSGRRIGFTQFGVADYSFDYVLPANNWNHVVFVGDDRGTHLYVNGTRIGSIPANINLPTAVIGARTALQDRMKGLLDEITLFNRALSPLEIQQLFNATASP